MMHVKDRNWLELLPPEGVPLRFEIARISDRVAALCMDLLFIFGAIVTLVLLSLLLVTTGVFTSALVFSALGSFFIIGMFIIRQGYFFFFELKWQGTTPGKRISKIRVISRDGGSLTLASIIARNLLRDLEIFIPLGILLSPGQLGSMPVWVWLPMLGWVGIMCAIPFLNSRHLRLGDLIAGTMLVRIPEATRLADKAAQTSECSARGNIPFTHKQLSIYGEFELQTLADILHKSDEGRAELKDLAIIAKTIANKIQYEGPEPQQEPLRFLRTFYTQQRKQLEANLLLGQRKASKYESK